MKRIFAVLIHYKDKTITIDCLKSLGKLHTQDIEFHIIVINNNPADQIEKKDIDLKNVEIINTTENLGFAGGQNVGIKRALAEKADYILIINNDVIVDPQFLQELKITVESDETIGAVSPKIYFAKGFEFHKEKYTEKKKGVSFGMQEE